MHLALKGLRPRQWTENVVLFAGLVFSVTTTNQAMVVGALASGNLKLTSRAGESGIGFVAVAGSVVYF